MNSSQSQTSLPRIPFTSFGPHMAGHAGKTIYARLPLVSSLSAGSCVPITARLPRRAHRSFWPRPSIATVPPVPSWPSRRPWRACHAAHSANLVRQVPSPLEEKTQKRLVVSQALSSHVFFSSVRLRNERSQLNPKFLLRLI